jgi:hypothetical protein
MIKISGLHLLLSYQCTFECDHCFVWGSPWQSGTMTLKDIRHIINQAKTIGTVEWIYFEGGEPTMFYPILLKGVIEANQAGFQVGLVSNTFWANSHEDAIEWLSPFAGIVQAFSISSDLYHYNEKLSLQSKQARSAAEALGIPIGVISIAPPEAAESSTASGQLPDGESKIMYRGRAAAKLAANAVHYHWEIFDQCPFEDLRNPGRIHVDPLGNMHICQGISIGNILQQPLIEITNTYDPDNHPITGPLLSGGPSELARSYNVHHEKAYADACHLCDHIRHQLRAKYPNILTPDQIYGVYN